MTFSSLLKGENNVDRLFVKQHQHQQQYSAVGAEPPQPFRHPLLAHIQHNLHSQLGATAAGGGGGGAAVGGGGPIVGGGGVPHGGAVGAGTSGYAQNPYHYQFNQG